jgi:exodeoxyribonuclease V alpha subunit
VGPGNVLHDIIASRRFTVAHLREIHRQDRHGLIVENAHRILDGELPRLPSRGVPSDFYFTVRDTPHQGAALVEHLFLERIPQRFGIDPRAGIQVLSPMHRGLCGVDALNTRLQEGLNPDDTGVAHRGRSFRVGDRVMQIRNDHDRGIMNGELGVVTAAEPAEGALRIRFDAAEEHYQGAQLDDLRLAFAMTVHKSQGGEFPAVILPLFTDHALMLRRNVLYTAVTRARDLLVVVGTRKALQMAVGDDRLTRRQGSFLERLQGHPIEPAPVA